MTPQELKASILQLAIQGKLVEQRPEDGTGEELFQRIQAEKQALIKAGKIKKGKPTERIKEEEYLFEIPDSWCWVRLGDISNAMFAGGDKPKDFTEKPDASRSIPVIANGITNDGILGYTSKPTAKENTITVAGRGTIGFSVFRDYEYCPIVRLIVIEQSSLTNPHYLQYVIEALPEKSLGTSIPQLTVPMLYPKVLPLPPLEEQKRIVAKLEEILPLIDRYEAAWNKLEEFNKRFPGDMQKSILQLAIQGKLVEQRPEEGTGEELFQQIQAEKQALIKAGKIKKDEPLSEISDEEISFDIPDTWCWVRLGDCSSYTQRKEKVSPGDLTGEMWSLDLEDIEKGSGRIIQYCKASDRKIAGDKVKFYKDQILYSKLRPYLKKVLVAPADGICTGEIVPFTAYGNIDPQYIVYVLTCPHVDYVINSVTYGVKMPRVGTQTMAELLIPLPPLAEQKRIVAKLEEILPLCDRLK